MVKYGRLLEDVDVKRWYDNLAAGSKITADVYLRGLGRYCDLNNTTPKDILEKADSKQFRDSFLDFVRKLESQHKAGSYITRYKKVVTSWCSHNGVTIKLKVNIKGASDSPTVIEEGTPSKENLAKILRKCSRRARVSAAIIAYDGIRPESLGDYEGKDGIKLGDFKEAKIKDNKLEFEKIPSMLVIRSNLCKSRHQYFTFVPQETITYITEYLEARVKAGEKLGPETPLLQFDERGSRRNNFLRTALVSRDIRVAMRDCGFNWRPYVLKVYCDTAYDRAENQRLISHPWRMFFMSHKGDIEARYSTNKRHLPPDMIEEMRAAYKKSSTFMLTTSPESATEEQLKKALKEQLLLVAGFTKEEVEKVSTEEMSDEELQNRIRQKLLGIMSSNGSRQRIVPISEVETYVIKHGYDFVKELPNDKALMRTPF